MGRRKRQTSFNCPRSLACLRHGAVEDRLDGKGKGNSQIGTGRRGGQRNTIVSLEEKGNVLRIR